MRAGNGTNDPADYDQTGGGGGVDPMTAVSDTETALTGGAPEGRLAPGQTSQPFQPRGMPPWTVEFTNVTTGAKCSQGGLTNAGVTVTIKAWDPCDIEVKNPGGGSSGR